MTDNRFLEFWDLHTSWSRGILFKDIKEAETVTFYLSEIPGQYYNFSVPRTDGPTHLDLEEIKETLGKGGGMPSIYLWEKHQQQGFVEHLIRNKYVLDSRESWMILNKKGFKKQNIDIAITQVTPQNFDDYYKVLSVVFSNFAGNEKYLEICLDSLKGKIKSKFSDFGSELYLIYDEGTPAAGAGLFYSKKGNFAYLHDAGTLEKYQGKGYQTALIRHRVQRALEEGIDHVYTLVEHGDTSWGNCIKNGFDQHQVANLFRLKARVR